jgi:hypothetical protein
LAIDPAVAPRSILLLLLLIIIDEEPVGEEAAFSFDTIQRLCLCFLMSSSSSWGKKLQAKLDALTLSSSKESCQTLALWIGFNRKQFPSFVPVLLRALASDKQPVVATVLNETMLLDRDHPAKWERMADVRMQLGESVLLPSASALAPPAKEKLLSWLGGEWEDANVFGERPAFGEQLRRALKAPPAPAPAVASGGATAADADQHDGAPRGESARPPSSPATGSAAGTGGPKLEGGAAAREEASGSSGDAKKEPPRSSEQAGTTPTKAPAEGPSTPIAAAAASPSATGGDAAGAKPSPLGRSASLSGPAAPFDFESRGIPAADVDPDELLRHSRQIATFQIGRDLRNDGAVQLSSLLASLPRDVRAALEAPASGGDEGGQPVTLDEDAARDYSARVSQALLDMDMDEKLQDVLHFRELVQKQQLERKKLLDLLVASRCDFGANQAAAAFLKADRSMGDLVERRQVLLDAMELEGLDVSKEEASAKDVKLDDLPPLTWYQPEAAGAEDGEPEAKRQRTRYDFSRGGYALLVAPFLVTSPIASNIHACQLSCTALI